MSSLIYSRMPTNIPRRRSSKDGQHCKRIDSSCSVIQILVQFHLWKVTPEPPPFLHWQSTMPGSHHPQIADIFGLFFLSDPEIFQVSVVDRKMSGIMTLLSFCFVSCLFTTYSIAYSQLPKMASTVCFTL